MMQHYKMTFLIKGDHKIFAFHLKENNTG